MTAIWAALAAGPNLAAAANLSWHTGLAVIYPLFDLFAPAGGARGARRPRLASRPDDLHARLRLTDDRLCRHDLRLAGGGGRLCERDAAGHRVAGWRAAGGGCGLAAPLAIQRGGPGAPARRFCPRPSPASPWRSSLCSDVWQVDIGLASLLLAIGAIVSAMTRSILTSVGYVKMLALSERDRADLREQTAKTATSDARLSEAHRLARFGQWEWDPETDLMTASSELYRLLELGDPRRPVPWSPDLTDRLHDDDRDRVQDTLRRAAKTGEGFSFDTRVLTPDGSELAFAGRWGSDPHEQGHAHPRERSGRHPAPVTRSDPCARPRRSSATRSTTRPWECRWWRPTDHGCG